MKTYNFLYDIEEVGSGVMAESIEVWNCQHLKHPCYSVIDCYLAVLREEVGGYNEEIFLLTEEELNDKIVDLNVRVAFNEKY